MFGKIIKCAVFALLLTAGFAGCRLVVGEMACKDLNAEVMSQYCNTNTVKGVMR